MEDDDKINADQLNVLVQHLVDEHCSNDLWYIFITRDKESDHAVVHSNMDMENVLNTLIQIASMSANRKPN